ncbi:sco1-like protein, mitochondrial [Plakobranchus ocellatus]|uniref:Sco1-like protein, mitochondrial n=1 Tax=Plakobranchus ocellatus TaxID=259542 RepID=A0AAV4A2M1_9GAST|nr:sco1-like protein, mitochondrial [Plakobranchus ocellatus]
MENSRSVLCQKNAGDIMDGTSPMDRPRSNSSIKYRTKSASNFGVVSVPVLKKFSHHLNGALANDLEMSSSARLFSTEQASENRNPPKKKSVAQSKKSPISWKTLLIVAGIGGAFAIGLQMVKKEKEEEMKKNRNRKMGKALLGGDWTLTDHHGKRRSSTEFRGQWILIYFGFTNCPDICPEEIEKIVRVINQTDADPALPKIQPIVITVDPERDTPEALKEYCGEFSPRLLGFTGTIEEITAATRAYRVYFSAGPKDEDNDYIVDHSIISYLVNPQGEFTEYFGQNKTSAEIYSSIKLHISAYNIAEKRNK